jgi:hypothetical protein
MLPQTPEADRPNQAGNRKTGCHARKGAKPECVFACEGHDISYMALGISRQLKECTLSFWQFVAG